jgi:hypothetical protein
VPHAAAGIFCRARCLISGVVDSPIRKDVE